MRALAAARASDSRDGTRVRADGLDGGATGFGFAAVPAAVRAIVLALVAELVRDPGVAGADREGRRAGGLAAEGEATDGAATPSGLFMVRA